MFRQCGKRLFALLLPAARPTTFARSVRCRDSSWPAGSTVHGERRRVRQISVEESRVEIIPYLALVSAVAALGLAVFFYGDVKKASPGDERMVFLMTEIQKGAKAFLQAGVHLGRRLRRPHGRPARRRHRTAGRRHLPVRRDPLGLGRLRRHDRGHDGQRSHHRGGQGRPGQGTCPSPSAAEPSWASRSPVSPSAV